MKPEIITSLAALAGVFIGALFGFGTAWMNKRYDDRRHRREILMRTAVENWKTTAEIAQKEGERTRQNIKISPLDDFIIAMGLLDDRIMERKLTPERIISALKEIDQIIRRIIELRSQQEQEPPA